MAAKMYDVAAWGKTSATAKFSPLTIQRNTAGHNDVTFDVKCCGICHTDIHFANGQLPTKWPCVPGHEMAGVVTFVGDCVTDIKVGDHVGVGYLVDSCLNCTGCKGTETFKYKN